MDVCKTSPRWHYWSHLPLSRDSAPQQPPNEPNWYVYVRKSPWQLNQYHILRWCLSVWYRCVSDVETNVPFNVFWRLIIVENKQTYNQGIVPCTSSIIILCSLHVSVSVISAIWSWVNTRIRLTDWEGIYKVWLFARRPIMDLKRRKCSRVCGVNVRRWIIGL